MERNWRWTTGTTWSGATYRELRGTAVREFNGRLVEDVRFGRLERITPEESTHLGGQYCFTRSWFATHLCDDVIAEVNAEIQRLRQDEGSIERP